MTELHAAAETPLTRELVDDVIAMIRENADYAANQAATLYGGPLDTNRKVADAAIYETWTHLYDQLGVRLALTLASHGVA